MNLLPEAVGSATQKSCKGLGSKANARKPKDRATKLNRATVFAMIVSRARRGRRRRRINSTKEKLKKTEEDNKNFCFSIDVHLEEARKISIYRGFFFGFIFLMILFRRCSIVLTSCHFLLISTIKKAVQFT